LTFPGEYTHSHIPRLLDIFEKLYYLVKMEQILTQFGSILNLQSQGKSVDEIAEVNGLTPNQVHLILSYHSKTYQDQKDLSRSTNAQEEEDDG